MEIDIATLPLRDRYKLLIGAIVPRPIAFVSTMSVDGKLNLAPFSFFTGVCAEPFTLLYCPANNSDGSDKDSLRNALPPPDGLGQFVVNIVTEAYADRMALTAAPLAWGESEFDHAGFKPAASARVRPPRVAESPIAMECETLETVRINPKGTPNGGNIVIGRAVQVYVDDRAINERFHIDAEVLRAVGRMGGLSYTRTRERFELDGRGGG